MKSIFETNQYYFDFSGFSDCETSQLNLKVEAFQKNILCELSVSDWVLHGKNPGVVTENHCSERVDESIILDNQ